MNETPPSPAAGDGIQKDLLLFQMGPVQEFIAQARSTKDLWSGSYLLSWLVAHAILAAWKAECGKVGFDDMVMPSIRKGHNPLLFALRDQVSFMEASEIEKALIPNLPNRFAMLVPAGTGKVRAKAADKAVRDELARIAKSVWEWLSAHGAKPEWRDRFSNQVKAFPQITWAVRPWHAGESFDKAWDAVNEALAARRNTREFLQWDPVSKDAAVKDSLSGKEECIGDEDFWDGLHRKCEKIFKTPGHRYGAMNLLKRLWCQIEDVDSGKNYLASNLVFRDRDIHGNLRVPDIPSIAERNDDPKVPYVAVLAFDGDHMGETVDAQKTSPDGIRAISATLSGFALDRVPGIVEKHGGHLIYAGGDDVLAVLPSSKVIACAREIRAAFHEIGFDGKPLDGSCGIAVGHKSAPLQMLVKSAQRMEGVAKGRYGRGALAIAVYKRSGEILEWGCKWESKSLDLLTTLKTLSEGNSPKLSGRFPYALAALLQPYELEKMTKSTDFEKFKDVLNAEVDHVLTRQGGNLTDEERNNLKSQISEHLVSVAEGVSDTTCRIVGREQTEEEKKGDTKVHPGDFLGLFLVETFLDRKREGK